MGLFPICFIIIIRYIEMLPLEEPHYTIYDQSSPKKQDKSRKKAQPYGYPDLGNGEYFDQCSFEFSDLSNKKSKNLGNYDPNYEYLTVSPGLNLKGMCQTPSCKANGKRTWIRLGFGEFDIGKCKHKSFCPCCKLKIPYKTIKSFGYTSTKIKIKGVKLVGQEAVPFEMEDSEKDGKFAYFTDYDENITKWEYLQVTATKI